MGRRTLFRTLQMVGVGLLLGFPGGIASAQAEATVPKPETGPVLKTLTTPEYPPLASMARITGDVNVTVSIGFDGSIKSVEATGHPLLKQAALASAQKSTYECGGCHAETTLSLTYSFQLKDGGDPCSSLPRPPDEVTQAQNRIIISATPSGGTCDPGSYLKVRSWKCLYLWKCGIRY